MIRNRALFTMMLAATLFATSAFSGAWPSSLLTVYAQASNNNSQAMAVDQLASNLTQAREAIASGNTTATTAQLTAIIGQLSDILGTVTSDPNGEATDEHTHFFVHKGHTHTVTHTHPHHPSHHHDWFERRHIFNPSDCKPGRMC
jgi:hypothetical protein